MKKIFTFIFAVMAIYGYSQTSVTYTFGTHATFEAMPVNGNYCTNTFDYDDATVVIDVSNRQGQTITDVPVIKNGKVTIKLKDTKKCITDISLKFKQWSTDNKNVNLSFSPNGTDFTSMGISFRTSSSLLTYPKTNLPPNSVAACFDMSDSSKKIGIESCTFTISDKVTTPIICATASNIDFGTLIMGESTSATKTLSVFGSNLTKEVNVSLAGDNAAYFAIDKTSFSPTNNEINGQINITYTPTQKGTNHSATLTLKSDEINDIVVNLTGGLGERSTSGNGAKETPYTTSDVISLGSPGTTAWVEGYVLGAASGGNTGGISSIVTNVNSNIALASVQGETDMTKVIPVQLPYGSNARTSLNVVDNPSIIGKSVKVYGTLSSYFTVPGVKSITDFVINDATGINSVSNSNIIVTTDGLNILVSGADSNGINVYNLSGNTIYSGYDSSISVSAPGIYLLKVNGKVTKVALR